MVAMEALAAVGAGERAAEWWEAVVGSWEEETVAAAAMDTAAADEAAGVAVRV